MIDDNNWYALSNLHGPSDGDRSLAPRIFVFPRVIYFFSFSNFPSAQIFHFSLSSLRESLSQ